VGRRRSRGQAPARRPRPRRSNPTWRRGKELLRRSNPTRGAAVAAGSGAGEPFADPFLRFAPWIRRWSANSSLPCSSARPGSGQGRRGAGGVARRRTGRLVLVGRAPRSTRLEAAAGVGASSVAASYKPLQRWAEESRREREWGGQAGGLWGWGSGGGWAATSPGLRNGGGADACCSRGQGRSQRWGHPGAWPP
jgi:hypothetical protein